MKQVRADQSSELGISDMRCLIHITTQIVQPERHCEVSMPRSHRILILVVPDFRIDLVGGQFSVNGTLEGSR